MLLWILLKNLKQFHLIYNFILSLIYGKINLLYCFLIIIFEEKLVACNFLDPSCLPMIKPKSYLLLENLDQLKNINIGVVPGLLL